MRKLRKLGLSTDQTLPTDPRPTFGLSTETPGAVDQVWRSDVTSSDSCCAAFWEGLIAKRSQVVAWQVSFLQIIYIYIHKVRSEYMINIVCQEC